MIEEREPFRDYAVHRSDVWTPMTVELRRFLEEMKEAAGGWKQLCERAGVKERYLRRVRNGERGFAPSATISLRVLDRLATAVDLSYRLRGFEWLNVDECKARGLWKPGADLRDYGPLGKKS